VIPKAEVLAVAEETGLLPTTVEKDYALGWVLFAIADHATIGRWYFKGGTCLKKCYLDTYRFSEDLDFTIRRCALRCFVPAPWPPRLGRVGARPGGRRIPH